MDKVFYNFNVSLSDVLCSTSLLNNDIVKLLKCISSFVSYVIMKIDNIGKQDILFSQTIDLYFKLLEECIGEMAGAMTKTEFYIIFSSIENITIIHIRKIFNAFWVLCKVIIPFLIYYGVNNKCNEMRLDMFTKNIHNGIIFVSNFMKDFTNIDEMLLCHVLSDGLNAVTNNEEPDRKITISHFYTHVIKMIHIGTRFKSQNERQNIISGYNYDFMNSISHIITKYLTDKEKTQISPQQTFPWTDKFIYAPDSSSHYYKFCKTNTIYFASGRSGSTFELMTMILIFFPDIGKNRTKMLALMMYFIHFHVVRGSHSILEIFLAFYDIIEYFQARSIYAYQFLSDIMSPFLKENKLIINKTNPTKDLISGTLSHSNELIKYSL